jgi:hypothetical protein
VQRKRTGTAIEKNGAVVRLVGVDEIFISVDARHPGPVALVLSDDISLIQRTVIFDVV